MPGLPSLRIAKVFGIPVEISGSWFFVFFLVAMTLMLGYFPQTVPGLSATGYAVMGVVTALLFFASVLLHELAHSLVARAGGLRIEKVTLFVFGGVSQMDDEPQRPGFESRIAAAGPLASLVLAGLFYGLTRIPPVRALHPLAVTLDYLGVINLSLGVFNLLPGFPLDGGRVLRAALWAATGDILKATRWASRMGQLIGMLLVGVAVFGVVLGHSLDLVWFGLIGWFISGLATAAYQQQVVRSRLHGIEVGTIMSTAPELIDASLTLDRLARRYLLTGDHEHYPVIREGAIVGLIGMPQLRAVPVERWEATTAGEAAFGDLAAVVVSPQTTVDRILARLEPDGPGAVLVQEEDRLAGIVTRADVIALLTRLDVATHR